MDQRGVGQIAVATMGRRRQTLWDQISAIDTGSGNAAVLGAADKRHPELAVTPTPAQANRTLLDIIRDEEPHGGSLLGHSNKKTWKDFRERIRIRIRRPGSAWISSIHVPTSDIPIRNGNNRHLIQHSSSAGSSSGAAHRHLHLMLKNNSVRFTIVSTLNTGETTHLDELPDGSTSAPSRPSMTRRSSTRFVVGSGSESDDHAVGDEPPAMIFRPQILWHNSTRFPGNGIEDSPRKLSVMLAEERAMSAREAVVAQVAAEAEDDEEEGESPGGDGPVRMSLMDLLEETDRQMGLEGSRYTVGEDNVEAGDGDKEEGPDEVEHTCCVCMVRHKGSAFIPCGHTFCRLCSRELWVQRGNCPLCNAFILEILDIF